MRSNIFKHAFINSLLAVLYVTLVSSFFFYVTPLFRDKPDTVMAPILMLMLLVFSAAMMAVLIFGRPILWYVEGRKKDAILLIFYTLGTLFLFLVAAFAGLAISMR